MNSEIPPDVVKLAVEYLAPWPEEVIGVIPLTLPEDEPPECYPLGIFLCVDADELPPGAPPPAPLLRAAVQLAQMAAQHNLPTVLAGRQGTAGWAKVQRNGGYSIQRFDSLGS